MDQEEPSMKRVVRGTVQVEVDHRIVRRKQGGCVEHKPKKERRSTRLVCGEVGINR